MGVVHPRHGRRRRPPALPDGRIIAPVVPRRHAHPLHGARRARRGAALRPLDGRRRRGHPGHARARVPHERPLVPRREHDLVHHVHARRAAERLVDRPARGPRRRQLDRDAAHRRAHALPRRLRGLHRPGLHASFRRPGGGRNGASDHPRRLERGRALHRHLHGRRLRLDARRRRHRLRRPDEGGLGHALLRVRHQRSRRGHRRDPRGHVRARPLDQPVGIARRRHDRLHRLRVVAPDLPCRRDPHHRDRRERDAHGHARPRPRRERAHVGPGREPLLLLRPGPGLGQRLCGHHRRRCRADHRRRPHAGARLDRARDRGRRAYGPAGAPATWCGSISSPARPSPS